MARKTTRKKAPARKRAAKRVPATTARVSTRRRPSAERAALEGRAPATESRVAESVPRARAAGRPETMQVAFDLRDVFGQPIRDPKTFFTFRRVADNRQISDQLEVAVTGGTAVFDLPAVAGDVVVCEIDPSRYRFVNSPLFFRSPGPPIRKECRLMREPTEWVPKFTAWGDLAAPFTNLKDVLGVSENVTLFRGTDSLGKLLVKETYDGLTGDDVVMAKTTLLNLYFRLNQTAEPMTSRNWFSFVKRIVAIGRERLLAFVEPDMEERVRQISDHIGEFRADYERTMAENHRVNVPPALQSRITKMVSIKSSHRKGNFQLTLTHLSGPDEVLLDTDLDESGDLLGHTLDILKHKFSGGTHPNDIHELLVLTEGQADGFDLGYRLV